MCVVVTKQIRRAGTCAGTPATLAAVKRRFLFAPYSVFTVESGEWSQNLDDDNPHIIHLRAAVDNRKQREDLPLAPWY